MPFNNDNQQFGDNLQLNRRTVDLLSKGLGLQPTVILEEVCSIVVINQQQATNSNNERGEQQNLVNV